jgi:hypothetical protein
VAGSPTTGWWAKHPDLTPKITAKSLRGGTVLTQYGEEISVEELEQEHASELPGRDLLINISLLGIPLMGITDVTALVNTVGPNWLASL